MKIIGGHVEWYVGYANDPGLRLVVKDAPALEDLRFKERDNLYYAELDGFVRFFYYSEPGNGYGGTVFTLRMEDGSTRKLIGPWSSRAGAMNAAGFGPCMDVAFIDNKGSSALMAGAVTVDLVSRNLHKIDVDPQVGTLALVCQQKYNEREPMYIPAVRLASGAIWQKNT